MALNRPSEDIQFGFHRPNHKEKTKISYLAINGPVQ